MLYLINRKSLSFDIPLCCWIACLRRCFSRQQLVGGWVVERISDIFQLNGLLIDKHLPDKRWTIHVLSEKYDAEEWDEDERRNTLLYVSLNAFHHVTQTLGDEVAVVYAVIVDDDSICTAVWYARADIVIFLMAWELRRLTNVWCGFHQHRYTFWLMNGHD